MDAEEDELEITRILEEKSKLEKERKAIRRRLKHLDHRILELRAAYGTILNEKPSVLQLPEELTRIIFLYAQYHAEVNGSLSDLPWNPSRPGPLPEVAVSHVCRQWRLISLAYPILWTRFRYDASRSSQVPLNRLKVYLQRSGLKSLELWFKFKDFDHDVIDCEDHLNLLETAIGHVQRWKRITVISDSQSPLLSAPRLLEWTSAPDLEYFAFCTNNRNDSADFPASLEPTIFKNGVPKLKSIILDSSIGQELFPPLHNITTLCLECPEMSARRDHGFGWLTFVRVLSLPYLINLSILGLVFDYMPPFESIDPIAMNNLKNLRFSKSGPFPRLLPFFKAPLLETLVIKDESLGHMGDGLPEPLGFPSLKSLSLIETRISLPAAQYLARMTELVTNITISNKKYDESLFSVFLRSSSEYWTNANVLTLDLDIGGRLEEVIGFAQTRDSGLVLRVSDDIVNQWPSTLFLAQPHAQAALTQLFHIEKFSWSNISPALWEEHWLSYDWLIVGTKGSEGS